MTFITWACLRCVQELATILGPQIPTQRSCALCLQLRFDDIPCICQEREMQEIEADLLSNKPDIVRLVHSNVRQPEPKYRTDENVLGR